MRETHHDKKISEADEKIWCRKQKLPKNFLVQDLTI